jgi:hypothetical protein
LGEDTFVADTLGRLALISLILPAEDVIASPAERLMCKVAARIILDVGFQPFGRWGSLFETTLRRKAGLTGTEVS